jgi:hypothetical protein
MKHLYVLLATLAILSTHSFGQTSPSDCDKLGFETGKGFLGWYGYSNFAPELDHDYVIDPLVDGTYLLGYIPLFDEATNYFPTSISGLETLSPFTLLKKSDNISGNDVKRDPFVNDIKLVSPFESDYIIRLGTSNTNHVEAIVYYYTVTEETKYVSYYYAFVFQDESSTGLPPYFYSSAYTLPGGGEGYPIVVPCTRIQHTPSDFPALPSVPYGASKFQYQNWTLRTLDLSAYVGQQVGIIFASADNQNEDECGYSYIDLKCTSSPIQYTGDLCVNNSISFTNSLAGSYPNEEYAWDFGDNSSDSSLASPLHTYNQAGTYNVTFTVSLNDDGAIVVKSLPFGQIQDQPHPIINVTPNPKNCYPRTYTIPITIGSCVNPCQECVSSFSPIPNGKYLLSAWVKEQYVKDIPDSYTQSGVRITFDNSDPLELMRPSGPIIDGWQRIEHEFTLPTDVKNMRIALVNENPNVDTFFDDIRIHPFKSNMKSFVYDPGTQKLTAELDENNYATLYEYDDEGQLIRVKKETERGVLTVKETRSNQSKISGK